jgi:N utilization substance protein B
VGSRHRARQYAVQVLFQLDVTGDEPAVALAHFWEGKGAPADVVRFAERLVQGAWSHRSHIDEVLAGSASHWKLERMAIVDRNVLRLALFEMLHEKETPAPVVLDEAIELAKQFGNTDSGPFVNGVLDAIRRRLEEGSLPTPDAVTSRSP